MKTSMIRGMSTIEAMDDHFNVKTTSITVSLDDTQRSADILNLWGILTGEDFPNAFLSSDDGRDEMVLHFTLPNGRYGCAEDTITMDEGIYERVLNILNIDLGKIRYIFWMYEESKVDVNCSNMQLIYRLVAAKFKSKVSYIRKSWEVLKTHGFNERLQRDFLDRVGRGMAYPKSLDKMLSSEYRMLDVISRKYRNTEMDTDTVHSLHRLDLPKQVIKRLVKEGITSQNLFGFCDFGDRLYAPTSEVIRGAVNHYGDRYHTDTLYGTAKYYGISVDDLLFLYKNSRGPKGYHDTQFLEKGFIGHKAISHLVKYNLEYCSIQETSEINWQNLIDNPEVIKWFTMRIKEIMKRCLTDFVALTNDDGIKAIIRNPKGSISNILNDIATIPWLNAGIPVEKIGPMVKAGYSIADYEYRVKPYLHIEPSMNEWIKQDPIVIDDFKLELVQRGDFSSLFLGCDTSCCQHPDGVAATAAWHGYLDPTGGFIKITKGDEIVAQSWIWKSDKILVIDNIEARRSVSSHPTIIEMYQMFAKCQTSDFTKIVCGCGYSKVDLSSFPQYTDGLNFPVIDGSQCYTDAKRAVILA